MLTMAGSRKALWPWVGAATAGAAGGTVDEGDEGATNNSGSMVCNGIMSETFEARMSRRSNCWRVLKRVAAHAHDVSKRMAGWIWMARHRFQA